MKGISEVPIHIPMQTGFALRNAIFTADALAPLLLLPLICVVVAWLARRDLWRALVGFAVLALLFDLLDILLTAAISPLENAPRHLTLPFTFAIQALYNIAGASNQLAGSLFVIVGALGLLLAAQREQGIWLTALAVLTCIASLAHVLVTNLGLPALNSLHFSSITASVIVALLEAALPLVAWSYASRMMARDARAAQEMSMQKAPSHQE